MDENSPIYSVAASWQFFEPLAFFPFKGLDIALLAGKLHSNQVEILSGELFCVAFCFYLLQGPSFPALLDHLEFEHVHPDHQVIGNLLNKLGISDYLKEIVGQYLSIPDTKNHGIGMVAGGALSPLLGALYLLPLDKAMQKYIARGDVYYARFMDDILVLANKRWQFRKVVKEIQQTTQALGLRLHDNNKRFIGRVDNGFEFLGNSIFSRKKITFLQHKLKAFERTCSPAL